ncbi:MAG: glycosyltransferase family 2 protein [Pyrinomonadaceae bacterium]
MGIPRASIIITTHSRPRLLLRAIKSARESGADVEVIVVDDASSDQTATLCRSLADEITYVRVDRNQGVAGAFTGQADREIGSGSGNGVRLWAGNCRRPKRAPWPSS